MGNAAEGNRRREGVRRTGDGGSEIIIDEKRKERRGGEEGRKQGGGNVLATKFGGDISGPRRRPCALTSKGIRMFFGGT
jgi:hypothetical protein